MRVLLIAVKVLAICWLLPSSLQSECSSDDFCPLRYSVDNETSSTVCEDSIATIPIDVQESIITDVSPMINSILRSRYLGRNSRYPAKSCREIKQTNMNSTSGYYWLQSASETIEMVWCNMELRCGPTTGGWARVAFVNVSDPSATCPGTNDYVLVTDPIRYCKRSSTDYACDSHFFSTKGFQYDSVCGRVFGIQIGTPDVFAGQETPDDISLPYVDGVSLTHGIPQQHIWTFASYTTEFHNDCPCSEGSNRTTPEFVGDDYFCESGARTAEVNGSDIFPNDPLWDGANCNEQEVRCCDRPPWFYKPLRRRVTDDIEFRLCADQDESDEQTAFTLIEIYVQ